MILDLPTIVYAICAIFAFSLGIAVYLDNIRGKTNRAFLGLTIAGLLWALFVFLRFNSDDQPMVLFYSRMTFSLATLVVFFFFRLTHIFPVEFKHSRDKYIPFIAVLVSLIAVSPLTVGNVEIISGNQVDTYGIGYYLFGLYFVILLGFGIFNLFRANRLLPANDKHEYRLMTTGFVIAACFGFLTNVLIPLVTGVTRIAAVGPISLLPFALFTGYAILRQHLFNVRVIASEILTFVVWIAIFSRILIDTNQSDRIIDSALFVFTVIIGILLVKSVLREVKTRERIEKLATELEKANTQLTEFDKQKSEFVSIASHQLRSPLTAIKGYASMLLENSYGQLSEKQREPVDRIFLSAESLVIVIENFLNISRIEQGRMHYEMEPINLLDLAKGAVDQLSPNAVKKGLTIDFTVKGSGPLTASIDKEKVRQCYLNFIDNAIKYTRTGSIHVTIERMNGNIRFSVADSGIGMKPETLARLFQKFSRADDASKTNAGGAGLGLFLASEIVKAHKGKVWAESAGQEKGSTFFIELPAM